MEFGKYNAKISGLNVASASSFGSVLAGVVFHQVQKNSMLCVLTVWERQLNGLFAANLFITVYGYRGNLFLISLIVYDFYECP
eukprot:g65153.t1